MSSAENTKLCDFASTNNNVVCSPISPPASPAAFYEIKPDLLNLVMKKQFSVLVLMMLLSILIMLLSFVRCKSIRI